jgi:hypothetical protein
MLTRSKSVNHLVQDPDLSKTLEQIRQELLLEKHQKTNMGDLNQSILRDLWIPQDQNTDIAQDESKERVQTSNILLC